MAITVSRSISPPEIHFHGIMETISPGESFSPSSMLTTDHRLYRQTPGQPWYPLAQATGRRERHYHEKLALRHRQGPPLHQAIPDRPSCRRDLRLFRLLSPASGSGKAGGGVHVGLISLRRSDEHFQVAWC